MKRRVGAIEEFSFEPLTLIGSSLQAQRTVKQLHITIAVTGWLNDANPGNIIIRYIKGYRRVLLQAPDTNLE